MAPQTTAEHDIQVIDDPVTDAATYAWAQYVANSPDETFTPRDRQMLMIGVGMCLVGLKVAENAE